MKNGRRAKETSFPDNEPCRANWHLLSARKKKLIINISKGNVERVEHLLIKDDMKYPIYEGRGALIVAASNKNESVKEMFCVSPYDVPSMLNSFKQELNFFLPDAR